MTADINNDLQRAYPDIEITVPLRTMKKRLFEII